MRPTRKTTTKLHTLEAYLNSCGINKDGEHFDIFNFSDATEAYDFGKSLRNIAIKEEGVDFGDQLQKFQVDISYMTVRIKLLVGELARC